MVVVAQICEEVGMRFKDRWHAIRPNMLEPCLRPFIDNPAHASYPSNHAFQSMAIAQIFARAVPEHPGNPELFRRAMRIAHNREWAGVHFPSDTRAGFQLAQLFLPVLEQVVEKQMVRTSEEWRG